ncbi:hypothetical protein UCRPC4_g00102 [Phaeomoniella chlamydospora]|uniref:Uncharacterized protein n=1 Tax=Phaeomoniella chlamydospora TaxID=158046 RepID=A0A0G2F4L6_PHACM|nr:hypothetical protein UCRPC4_g00102 [Phaeomoniella chlamydospora]
MGPPGRAPSRQSTHEALEKLIQPARTHSLSDSRWYTPGVDFCFYAPAQDACGKSRERLENLKLQDEELKLLESDIRPDNVVAKLREISDEQEKKSKRSAKVQKASDFLVAFCTFADKTSNIVMLLLPQSPEYSVTFGLMFLVFKACNFYKTVFPTNAIKASVARIYVHIMKLLDEAVVFYRGGKLSKLVDAVLQPTNKFSAFVSDIEDEIKVLNALKDAEHVAQAANMMEVVSGTGHIVARMYENVESQSVAVGTSMEILNTKLDLLTAQTKYMLHFETIKHARTLQEALLPMGNDPQEELEVVLGRRYHLSQKDHWENNGVLEDLLGWSRQGHKELLWIGGSSGNQDNWVTELSGDMVQALQPQLLTLLFVFCDRGDRESLSPLTLLRKLLVHLLDLRPDLAYRQPEICNLWRFQKSVTFRQTWRIFEELASMVADLFIIIDRIEECEADDQGSILDDLLPSLIGLRARTGAIVMVTSSFEPPLEINDIGVYSSYIDTARRPIKRDTR